MRYCRKTARAVFPKIELSLLEEISSQSIDIGLICDALDFLTTDYWDNPHLRISDHEMYGRCSDKYGRRFEIRPTGEDAINYTPGQYNLTTPVPENRWRTN